MARILFLNPNRNQACGRGISAAVQRFRRPDGPIFDVISLPDGPSAIVSWQDWHEAVGPLCRAVQRETADLYVIACVSDPGYEALKAIAKAPVLGAFRCAVAAAVAGAERFGIIAMADASIGRHRLALRAMGLDQRLAGEIALNLPMETLLDPIAARQLLIDTGSRLVETGAEVLILGCTGMAHHRNAIAAATGLAVIEPCQAAAALALARLPGS